jgi:ankyrin repeat protein
MNIKRDKLIFLGILFCSASGLFCKSVDISSCDTILMKAVKQGEKDFVAQLIEQGEDVNWHDGWDGLSVLMAAIIHVPFDCDEECYDFGIIKKLIDAGADVNARAWSDFPKAGQTVLGVAIATGLVEVVNMLIDVNAKVKAEVDEYVCGHKLAYCSRNIPLLSYAIAINAPIKIVEALLKAGADVNQHGWMDFYTPLMIAVRQGNAKAVELLLEFGADTTLRNKNDNNKTALDYAKKEEDIVGRLDIVQMLVNANN